MAQQTRTRTGDVFKVAEKMRSLGIEELEIHGKFKIKLGDKPMEPSEGNTDALTKLGEDIKKSLSDDDLLFHSS